MILSLISQCVQKKCRGRIKGSKVLYIPLHKNWTRSVIIGRAHRLLAIARLIVGVRVVESLEVIVVTSGSSPIVSVSRNDIGN